MRFVYHVVMAVLFSYQRSNK